MRPLPITIIGEPGIRYIDFVTWKKECYIKPSYGLLPQTAVFQFLQQMQQQKIPNWSRASKGIR